MKSPECHIRWKIKASKYTLSNNRYANLGRITPRDMTAAHVTPHFSPCLQLRCLLCRAWCVVGCMQRWLFRARCDLFDACVPGCIDFAASCAVRVVFFAGCAVHVVSGSGGAVPCVRHRSSFRVTPATNHHPAGCQKCCANLVPPVMVLIAADNAHVAQLSSDFPWQLQQENNDASED